MFTYIITVVAFFILLLSAFVSSFFNKETTKKLMKTAFCLAIYGCIFSLSRGMFNLKYEIKDAIGYDNIYNNYFNDKLKTVVYTNEEAKEIESVHLYVENGYKADPNEFIKIYNSKYGQYEIMLDVVDDDFCLIGKRINKNKSPLDINIIDLNNLSGRFLILYNCPYYYEAYSDMNSFDFNGGYIFIDGEFKYFDKYDFKNVEIAVRTKYQDHYYYSIKRK